MTVIFITDTEWDKHRDTPSKFRNFNNKKEAEEYLEKHPRPYDLDVVFDEKYFEREIEHFDNKKQIETIHIKVLELINLGNHVKAIARSLNLRQFEFMNLIETLKINNLIEYDGQDSISYNKYKLTEKGKEMINTSIKSGDIN